MRRAALALIALATAAVAPPRPFETVYPVEAWPIVSSFGSLDAVGGGLRSSPNEGVDIIALVRTPVFAAEHGVITLVAIEPVRGKVVEVQTTETGEPYTLVYAHLHAINVTTGDVVPAGQRLGTVGDTGVVPRGIGHLHFEVRTGEARRAMDPEPFLRSLPRGVIECVEPGRAARDGYPPSRFRAIRSGEHGGAAFLYPVACIRGQGRP